MDPVIDNAPDCYVAESGIHGRGLFAGRDFDRGEVVLDYAIDLDKWKLVKFEDLDPWRIANEQFIGLSSRICLTTESFCKFSYVNHSRKPNCWCDFTNFVLHPMRPVKKGEEITIDYRTEPRSKKLGHKPWV